MAGKRYEIDIMALRLVVSQVERLVRLNYGADAQDMLEKRVIIELPVGINTRRKKDKALALLVKELEEREARKKGTK